MVSGSRSWKQKHTDDGEHSQNKTGHLSRTGLSTCGVRKTSLELFATRTIHILIQHTLINYLLCITLGWTLRTQRWLRTSFCWGQGRRKIVQNDKLPRSIDRGARWFPEEVPCDVHLKAGTGSSSTEVASFFLFLLLPPSAQTLTIPLKPPLLG